MKRALFFMAISFFIFSPAYSALTFDDLIDAIKNNTGANRTLDIDKLCSKGGDLRTSRGLLCEDPLWGGFAVAVCTKGNKDDFERSRCAQKAYGKDPETGRQLRTTRDILTTLKEKYLDPMVNAEKRNIICAAILSVGWHPNEGICTLIVSSKKK